MFTLESIESMECGSWPDNANAPSMLVLQLPDRLAPALVRYYGFLKYEETGDSIHLHNAFALAQSLMNNHLDSESTEE